VRPNFVDLTNQRDTVAPGQAMEFRIWAELIQQSRGRLHVFLPLLDRGLDAVIHRLTDGVYIPVQIKGRAASTDRSFEIMIPGNRLVEDHALLIAGQLGDEGLSSELLVITEATFKQLAAHDVFRGEEIYWAIFARDSAANHWQKYMVPREQLATRLLGEPAPMTEIPIARLAPEPADRHNQWLGFFGESEVIRQLASNSGLDLFRPFPDLEMVEVLARERKTGRFAGLQVKTAIPAPNGEAFFRVRKATFAPTATTWITCLAWLPDQSRFADQCLLIPTNDLLSVAGDGDDRWVLMFNLVHPRRTPVDPYRRPLSDLGRLVTQIAGPAQ